MGYWIHKGMPAEKVIMGIPTYGHSFTLASANTAIGAPASSSGAAGPITKSPGDLAYYEVPGTSLCSQAACYVWERVPVPIYSDGRKYRRLLEPLRGAPNSNFRRKARMLLDEMK